MTPRPPRDLFPPRVLRTSAYTQMPPPQHHQQQQLYYQHQQQYNRAGARLEVAGTVVGSWAAGGSYRGRSATNSQMANAPPSSVQQYGKKTNNYSNSKQVN